VQRGRILDAAEVHDLISIIGGSVNGGNVKPGLRGGIARADCLPAAGTVKGGSIWRCCVRGRCARAVACGVVRIR